MLNEEIQQTQRMVKTDAYQISIGELINMYKDGELVINPDFQRLFRWEIGQKSKLVESLLLGIPLPSIFVFEKEDATWELIDGLQRISTILEFIGILKEPTTNDLQIPSCLVATKYLPSLSNVVWEKTDQIAGVPVEDQSELEKPLQLAIRRSRISVEILKRPSDNDTKYDLFQRLNAGGTPANAQELRNCIIIMVSENYHRFVKRLAGIESFLSVLAANEDQLEKQRHMEYVSRFLVQTYIPYDGKLDVEEYIDDGIIKLAKEDETAAAETTFTDTFRMLDNLYGNKALRRLSDGTHTGRATLAAFECLAIGIAKNISHINAKANPEDFVRGRVESFWTAPDIEQFFTPGLRGTTRIQKTVPFGAAWFNV